MSTSVWQEVSNWLFGSFKVRASQLTDASRVQHIRLDVGSGTTESQVTSANPLPVGVIGTGAVNVAQYGGTATTLGQKVMTASVPVTLASDQSEVTVAPNYLEGGTADDASPGFFVGGRGLSDDKWVAFRAVKGGGAIAVDVPQFVTSSMLYGWDGGEFRPVFLGSSDSLTVDIVNSIGLSATVTPSTFSSVTHTQLAVTTASQTALASNASRRYALFQNDSDTVIYLNLDGTAVASTGIRLNPNGGWYEINYQNPYTGIVTAIHAGTGSKTLMISAG